MFLCGVLYGFIGIYIYIWVNNCFFYMVLDMFLDDGSMVYYGFPVVGW